MTQSRTIALRRPDCGGADSTKPSWAVTSSVLAHTDACTSPHACVDRLCQEAEAVLTRLEGMSAPANTHKRVIDMLSQSDHAETLRTLFCSYAMRGCPTFFRTRNKRVEFPDLSSVPEPRAEPEPLGFSMPRRRTGPRQEPSVTVLLRAAA